MPKVCLLSPAPMWVNPRLRKEADALHAAGYDVVVGYRADGDVSRDDAILAGKPWRWRRIDLARRRHGAQWMRAAVRERAAGWFVRAGFGGLGVARAAYCRGDRELLEWATEQDADLYIAHTQPVLAIAAAAAQRRKVPFAFDCEDLLAEEAADGGRAPWRRHMIGKLEAEYLPKAAYVSATSEPMAQYLRERYSLSRVPVLHNCFPAAEGAGLVPPEARRTPDIVELTWISATIARGRGLEDAFMALRGLGHRVAFHLYGDVAGGCTSWLTEQIASLSDLTTVVVHRSVAADAVIGTIARHQIGLTLDGNDCLNRSLTACNKLFYYLQAGLACIATDTAGHRSVMPAGTRYGELYPPGDIPALVAVMKRLLDRDNLAAAQRAAWEIGRTRFVWDVEQTQLLDAVVSALSATPHLSDKEQ